MAVPDYQSLMLPVLRAIADGQSHRMADVRVTLAEQLGLTDEDRALKIPIGSPVFDSRVHWAVTYMAQAGLIRRPRQAVVELTARGQEVLAANPSERQRDFTVRKQILWESEIASDPEVSRMEVQFIRQLRANDPEIGYNRWPAATGPTQGADETVSAASEQQNLTS